MTKEQIMNNVTRTLHKGGFWLKKHSPEILTVVGSIGAVTGAVMACKATTKINPILEETKKNIECVHTGAERGEIKAMVNGEVTMVPYSEKDAQKDLAIYYAQGVIKLAKLYAPAVLVGASGLMCLWGANNLLHKRNAALTAAYATAHQSLDAYRGRVVERFGKDLDRELMYNIKAKEIEETVTNEDGTEQIVKKTVEVSDPNMNSIYARFFDESCKGWTKSAEDNLRCLKMVQAWANRKLQSEGYLYLNDVYEALGIPKTKAGHVVGWIYDEAHPVGDNYVDFGIYDLYNEKARDFVNGYERVILLDFNVDGNIWELMQ
jgi:hypothetical protein